MDLIKSDISRILSAVNIEFFNNKRIFITGASGLLGGYFAQTLQQGLDLGSQRTRLFLSSKSGEFQFDTAPQVEIITGDLSDHNILDKLPMFDLIIHAAGYSAPENFLNNPLLTIKINTATTSKLVEKLNKNGKFLFVSSSEVYSGLELPPFIESQIGLTNTDHIRSSYIEGKRSGEAIMAAINGKNGINAKSIRLSLVYGPGTKKGDKRVLNSFIEQAICSSRIELKDSGSVLRTYCYVVDAVEMCFLATIHGKELIYNVGGISKISIIDLAKLIAKITDSDLSIPDMRGSYLSGAPVDVSLDLSKILTLKNNSNFIGLDEGLKRTIDWQKEVLFNSIH